MQFTMIQIVMCLPARTGSCFEQWKNVSKSRCRSAVFVYCEIWFEKERKPNAEKITRVTYSSY